MVKMPSLRTLFAVFVVLAFFGQAESALMRGPAWYRWSRTKEINWEETNQVRQSRMISQVRMDRLWRAKWFEGFHAILKSLQKDGQPDITLNILVSSIFGRIM